MTSKSIHTVSRASRRFLSGTLLSRVTGMLREMTMAAAFGSHPVVAAFWVAFRWSNLFRRILGEGGLQASFIPTYEGLRCQDPQKAAFLLRDMTASLLALLVTLIVVVEGVLWLMLSMDIGSPAIQEILVLTAWMLPGLCFISLYGLNAGILQCEGRFFTAAAAPVAFNMVWIGLAWSLRSFPLEQAMRALAIGVVVAYAFQWLWTVPLTWKMMRPHLGKRVWSRLRFFSKEVRGIKKNLGLSLIGIAATQFNSGMDLLFARWADLSGPAYLSYALRLEQVPISLLGISLASALLPVLSRAVKEKEQETVKQLLSYSLQRNMALLIPGTLATWGLATVSVNLLFGRGAFDSTSTHFTSLCLCAYALGMLPTTLVITLAGAFYAKGDYRTPTLYSTWTVLCNLILNSLMVFVFHWGAVSVALATSCSAFFNSILLLWTLTKRERWITWEGMGRSGAHLLFISCVAAGAVFLFQAFFFDHSLMPWSIEGKTELPRNVLRQGGEWLASTAVFLGVLVAGAWLTRCKLLLDFLTRCERGSHTQQER